MEFVSLSLKKGTEELSFFFFFLFLSVMEKHGLDSVHLILTQVMCGAMDRL